MENENISEETQIKTVENKAADKASEALDLAVDLLEDIQKVVSSGRPKSIKVKLGDRVVADVPVALTAAAAVFAGLAAVMLTKLAIEVEHEEEDPEVI